MSQLAEASVTVARQQVSHRAPIVRTEAFGDVVVLDRETRKDGQIAREIVAVQATELRGQRGRPVGIGRHGAVVRDVSPALRPMVTHLPKEHRHGVVKVHVSSLHAEEVWRQSARTRRSVGRSPPCTRADETEEAEGACGCLP